MLAEMGIEIQTHQKVDIEEKTIDSIMQKEMTQKNKETWFRNERFSYKIFSSKYSTWATAA